jgi:hypothetical protein
LSLKVVEHSRAPMMSPLPSQLDTSLFIETLNAIKISKSLTAVSLPNTIGETRMLPGAFALRCISEQSTARLFERRS